MAGEYALYTINYSNLLRFVLWPSTYSSLGNILFASENKVHYIFVECSALQLSIRFHWLKFCPGLLSAC